MGDEIEERVVKRLLCDNAIDRESALHISSTKAGKQPHIMMILFDDYGYDLWPVLPICVWTAWHEAQGFVLASF